MLSKVDLPQPDGPITQTSSPASISRLMSASAAVSTVPVRYTLEMFRSWKNACSSGMAGRVQVCYRRNTLTQQHDELQRHGQTARAELDRGRPDLSSAHG